MNKVKKILYCGMADDIMAPLILEGHLNNRFNEMIIYVIDRFDPAFSHNQTIESQRDDIVNILKNGSDESSHSRFIYLQDSQEYDDNKKFPEQTYSSIHKLPLGKCDILYDIRTSNTWELKFIYCDIHYTLKTFSHNFLCEKWANEICDLTAIMFMGSYTFNQSDEDLRIFTEMLNTRRHKTQPCAIYALSFIHRGFPEHFIIKDGKDRYGTCIGRIYLQNNDDATILYDDWHVVNDSAIIKFL